MPGCGCGYLEQRMELLRQVLRDCPLYEGNKGRSYDSPLGEWLLCVADSSGLIEHGTTIQGSWITSRGKRLLAVLNDETAWARLIRDEGEPVGYCECDTCTDTQRT
jgi:hypothetical protein